ncbi:MAG: UDP-glucose/GDP-mannose dehydrogenase family protein [Deltaproteobacteria bacterium]|nr:UDP-glucose/GDP-mannose dehydrogenase family protein [Deltaproteobacteria bacterium]
MRLTVVGTGYVGLVSGTCLANTGNDVACLDIDERKIARLLEGISPIYEPGLDELIARNVKAGRLNFTTDKAAAYAGADAIFICVGTPSDDRGRADLKFVLAVADDVGVAIEEGEYGPDGPMVIVKSTVPVGTNKKVRAVIEGRTSKPFRMASNPEFLKEGDAILDFNKPDRVVVGVEDELTAAQMRELYEPYVRQGNPIQTMDIPSAEMVKYASNCMLATKISFINEMANLCEVYGADIDEVRRGMSSDRRIGKHFLYPGLGYGGSCFPKDVLAVMSMGEDSSTPTDLLDSVHAVNQAQRQAFIRKVQRGLGEVEGKRIAVWGIAFKPGTDDIREAPSITVMDWLLEQGASVVAFDPVAHETAGPVYGDRITFAANALEALEGADALIIHTEWNEFRHPDFKAMKRKLKTPTIFDGRNIYRPEQMRALGFSYYSVGRADVA